MKENLRQVARKKKGLTEVRNRVRHFNFRNNSSEFVDTKIFISKNRKFDKNSPKKNKS